MGPINPMMILESTCNDPNHLTPSRHVSTSPRLVFSMRFVQSENQQPKNKTQNAVAFQNYLFSKSIRLSLQTTLSSDGGQRIETQHLKSMNERAACSILVLVIVS